MIKLQVLDLCSFGELLVCRFWHASGYEFALLDLLVPLDDHERVSLVFILIGGHEDFVLPIQDLLAICQPLHMENYYLLFEGFQSR